MPDVSNELQTIDDNIYGEEVVQAVIAALKTLNDYQLETMSDYKQWFDMVYPYLNLINVSKSGDSIYHQIQDDVDTRIAANIQSQVTSALEQMIQDKVDDAVDDSVVNKIISKFESTYIKNIAKTMYPVGSIFFTVKNENPGTTYAAFSGTTWVAWGSGKVPVGVDTSDDNFKTVEKTGGYSRITITEAQMPKHTHVQNAHNHGLNSHTHSMAHTHGLNNHTHSLNSHTHSITPGSGNSFLRSNDSTFNNLRYRVTAVQPAGAVVEATAASSGVLIGTPTSSSKLSLVATLTSGASSGNTGGSTASTAAASSETTGKASGNTANTTAVNQTTGKGESHLNLQPYITCYMWKRTV